MSTNIVVFLAALGLSLALTPAVTRLALSRGWVDAPTGGRRIHTRPVPRLGGIAVFGATALTLLGAAALGGGLAAIAPVYGAVLAGAALLFAVGLLDDLKGLSPAAKFGLQVLAALLVYLAGVRIEVLALGPWSVALGALALPVTLFWIVGATNAFNLIDGMDGLASGIGIVALLAIATAAAVLGHAPVVVMALALAGALLGFLRYNFNPASIFLGDSGSLFVGFLLAALAIHAATTPAATLLVALPLAALTIPLLDTALAMARRWLRGTPMSGADARHLHHRLLALGLSQRGAALVLYATAAAIAGIGLAAAFVPPPLLPAATALGLVAVLSLVVLGVRGLRYHEFEVAVALLVSGPSRARRVIRDRINATDLARVIETAGTLAEVQAILEDGAADFGFRHMEVCREGVLRRPAPAGPDANASYRTWKVDYPVFPGGPGEDHMVLRIWCDPMENSRPHGALRVGRTLAPVLESWLHARHPVIRVERESTETEAATLQYAG